MTESRNGILRYESFAANRAVATLGKTGFLASGCYSLINFSGVTLCVNLFSVGVACIVAAGEGLNALFSTSRSGGYNAIVPRVFKSRDGLGSYKDISADLTFYACGRARLGAGRSNRRDLFLIVIGTKIFLAHVTGEVLVNIGMRKLLNRLGIGVARVVCTSEGLNALLGTSGSGGYNAIVVCVTDSRDGLLSYESVAAIGAMATLGKTGTLASGSYSRINCYGVTLSIDLLGVGVACIVCTSEGLNALLGTSGSGGYNAVIVSVSQRLDSLHGFKDLSAGLALLARCRAPFCTSGSLCLGNCLGFCMSAGRKSLHLGGLLCRFSLKSFSFSNSLSLKSLGTALRGDVRVTLNGLGGGFNNRGIVVRGLDRDYVRVGLDRDYVRVGLDRLAFCDGGLSLCRLGFCLSRLNSSVLLILVTSE